MNVISTSGPLSLKSWVKRIRPCERDSITSVEFCGLMLHVSVGPALPGLLVTRMWPRRWTFQSFAKLRTLRLDFEGLKSWWGTPAQWEEEKVEVRKHLEALNPGVKFLVTGEPKNICLDPESKDLKADSHLSLQADNDEEFDEDAEHAVGFAWCI